MNDFDKAILRRQQVNRWVQGVRNWDSLPTDKQDFIRRQFDNLARTIERYAK